MIPSRLRPLTCNRYIDVFLPPLFGSRLMHNPSVINGGGSFSEKIGMGSGPTATSLPVRTTSLHGALETSFGGSSRPNAFRNLFTEACCYVSNARTCHVL